MKVISFANQKGGVGKTTLSVNLFYELVCRGRNVLLVDLDPSGHATEHLGFREEYKNSNVTLYDFLVEEANSNSEELLFDSYGGYVIPSSRDMISAEMGLYTAEFGRNTRLKRLLQKVGDGFDYCLIDCPPTLGALTINSFVASDRVMVPFEPNDLSMRAMELLFQNLKKVREYHDSEVRVLKIVPNKVLDTKVAQDTLKTLRESLDIVWEKEIRKRTVFEKCFKEEKPLRMLSKENSSVNSDMLPRFEELAEIIERV
ncbi:hypothetical protein AKJ38_00390 [candidate division MSBL1 archaeon SCGC-AAA259I14]|uniref:AAA domain-containing protein n=3 Tax=candidate division MSBL1 TaxID=215777 RepID=A0A133UUF7_9EURY|nr:hypothetical protein AKJ66_00465 [candidate division MSBL1 archaeon SCGC-AAA259E22]KXA95304.1 hypothetical protein AKJ36_00985 [candidate division MSBL1 archaeon SCGC-AAA259I07]KXA97756.1 hypothetical protein AKJ38_00390 [candidate division MSBL1 archaeon SCGC-AAA259I14]